MVFKLVSESIKLFDGVIMTNVAPSIFPDVLLRIEVGCTWRQETDFQGWMVDEELTKGWAAMPGCTVPEEQNGLVGIGGNELVEKQHGGDPIHDR